MLFIGRLAHVKGAHVLVEAAVRLLGDADVVIAGDGPQRDRLQAHSSDIGAGVQFVGAVPFDRRHEWIAAADVVVVPSLQLSTGRSEGTPVAALEAMAAGVPVVASRVGGLAKLPASIFVRPNDSCDLARAIDNVLRSPPDTAASASFARALDWAHVGPRLDRLFRRTA